MNAKTALALAPIPAALAELHSLKAYAAKSDDGKKTDLFRLRVMVIEEEPGFNARFEGPELEASIETLTADLMLGAKFPPLDVRVVAGRVFVVDGHRRLRAYKRAIARGAAIEFVDCLEFKGNDVERVFHMFSTASGAEKLKPLEIALKCKLLRDWNVEIPEIAARMHCDEVHVANMLIAADADRAIQTMIREGKVTLWTAVDAIKAHKTNAAQVLKDGLAEAKSMGKTKLTASVLTGKALPKKVVGNVLDAFRTFTASVPKAVRKELAQFEKMSEEELKGQQVTLDAATVLALFKAHGELVDAEKKREEKVQQKKDKASQMELPGAEA